ncbi:response regulator [Zunongwangia pacifica]|uniref:histidine kinase n=1 Tax=Zunongwangia pacifica TaxID=2911062 RepID=A0A9X2CP52_9FLAO|nr:response regulator [Zunongwangia pacifica]MCL6219524.1 response regulator [Zunongwangia pacifica]
MKFLPAMLIFWMFTSSIYAQKIEDSTTISSDSTRQEIIAYLERNQKKAYKEIENSNYSAVVLYSHRNLNLAKKIGDSLRLAIARSYIGNAYLNMQNLEEARYYINENIKMAEAMNDTLIINAAKIDLANIYLKEKKYEDFIRLNEEVIDLAQQTKDNYRLITSSLNIAEAYLLELDKPDLAKKFIDSAKVYNIRYPDESQSYDADFYYLDAEYAFEKGNFKEAEKNFKLAIELAKDNKGSQKLLSAYSGYLSSQAELGNYKEAYESFKILDTLFENKVKSVLEESNKAIQDRIEIENVEQQIKNKELQNTIISARAEKNKILLIASAVLLVLLLLVLLFFIFERKKRTALMLKLQNKNEEYLDAKEKSEEMARVKTKFLSTISHELRTPLYGIIGLSNDLFLDPELSSHKKELQSLKFSATYLLNLVNDVLTLNKIESGSFIKLERVPFNLQELLEDINISLNFIRQKNNNKLTIKIDKEIPKILLGDKIKLSQILINLAGNALKFTNDGEIKILVDLIQKEEKWLKLKFQVKDNGIGISEEEQKEIFKEYGNLIKTSTFAGTGLGLNIVTKLLKEMNSEIQLRSKTGEGSNFYFELKLEIADQLEVASPAPSLNTDKSMFAGKKILIIDDNHINQLVTRKYIERYGITAKSADDAVEALEMLKTESFDLVFMDLNMPKLNGLEASSMIRSFNKEIKIIILSATEGQELRDKIKGYDINDFLSKPYKTKDLYDLLVKYLK